MKVTFEIETERTGSQEKESYRAAAAYLLHLAGDLKIEETANPKGIAPVAATAAGVAVTATGANAIPPSVLTVSDRPWLAPNAPPAPSAVFIPPPPPLVPTDTVSNILNFPVPPPPPPLVPADSVVSGAATNPATVTVASNSVPPPTTASQTATNTFEYDAVGMPWDARIHQKTKNKKKDLTWKLQKGIDPAIVQAVTAELAARKGASAPVSLPPAGANTVSVPTISSIPAPPGVPPPPPPLSSSVSVPPPPGSTAMVGTAGPVGAISAYRALIDKITAATKAKTITPQQVSQICQDCGAPSLMALNTLQHLIPDVDSRVEAVLAGLA